MKERKRDWKKIISRFVFYSFIIPIGYLFYKIVTTSNLVIPNNIDGRVRSDYILMLIQCLLGIFAMGLPSIISKKFKLEIPNLVFYLYLIFLWAAIFLGEVQNFYYRFKYWDLFLHTISGGMIGFIGFSFVDILNNEDEHVQLNPFFVAFFAFCFSLALGTIWEIYEFICDGVLKTNMQKYAFESGIKLIGRDALKDTVIDLIVDSIGALVATIIGYISIKYDKGYLNNFLIKFKKDKKGLKK
ncbi:MAG: hypothetical protein IKM97_02575 [Clostridia bacterium]|nr:hypothetical protein [Clostridia bacterium]